MNRLVIEGCGRLAEIITNAVVKGMLPDHERQGVYSRTASKAEHIANKMRQHGKMCAACHTFKRTVGVKNRLSAESNFDFAAMKELALPTLENGTSIIITSFIGAGADTSFYEKVKETAKANDTRVYLVSGATGGFDVLRTTSLMGNATARFFNEKGPDALKGTSVYKEELQQEKRIVFSGNATEAINVFPTKVNVSVAASLASVGPDNMQVSIQSTPGFTGDTQKVEIKNEQVHAVVEVYSATSEIAGWSVVNTLLNITSPIVF